MMMAQRKFKSKILWSLLFLGLFLWSCHYVYHNKALGFSVAKITSDFPYNPRWDVDLPTREEQKQIDQILSQPFYYLGAGSQSYAFESVDGKTVIKFFRMKHQIWHLKDLWTQNRSEERKQNLFAIYDSHQLAYQKMKDDAGLIYVHLNKTEHLNKKIKLIDRLHRTYVVDLDQVEFVLQKKAELIFSRLGHLLSQGNREGFNEALSSVMHLVERRVRKGIADHDKAVTHNFGFVGNQAIQIDVGRIYLGEKPKEYDRILERVDKWCDEQN